MLKFPLGILWPTLQMAARYLSLDQDELMSSLLNSGLGPVTIQGLDLYI